MTDSFRPTVIRNKAWADLQGKWGNSAIACLIMLLITGALSAIPVAGFIISLFVTSMITMGGMFLWLDVSNQKDVEIKTLFEPFNDYSRYLVGYLLVFVYTFLWSLLLVIPGIIKGLSYSMTYFIMRENPGMKGSEALELSMKMMDGHKMELFLLQLSFIGWIFLGMLAFGIGLFWVCPYIYTAQAEFYKELKKDWEVRQGFNAAA